MEIILKINQSLILIRMFCSIWIHEYYNKDLVFKRETFLAEYIIFTI